MRHAVLVSIGLLAVAVGIMTQSQPAGAAFHLMRIHAVMSGFNGDNTIQFVELRMCAGAQNLVGGQLMKFYDSAGTLKATFTFPTFVSNAFTGDSILIATAEYNAASVGPGMGGSGGDADFVFSVANTVGANGGDPLHPVQSPGGKVTFAEGADGCDAGFGINAGDVDSVAYGGAPADWGSAATALPSPSDNRALRLNMGVNVAPAPSDNSTDYALLAVTATAKTVASADLPTDLDTPRNNARQVATFQTDSDGDGIPDGSDNCPNDPNPNQENSDADPLGDACDNCPTVTNADQRDMDNDGLGNHCDDDTDGDGTLNTTDTDDDADLVTDAAEGPCGSDPLHDLKRPERVDGAFASTDDDQDGMGTAEALPGTAAGFDCDGDGYPGGNTGLADQEDRIYSASVPSTQRDQDPCGNDGWPSETFSGGSSANNVNLQDFTAFVTPPQNFQNSPLWPNPGVPSNDPLYKERFNLFNGGASVNEIDLQDLTAMVTGGMGGRERPPMLGGARAFDSPTGPPCPWPP